MKYIIHRGVSSYKIRENTYESIKKGFKDSNSYGVEFDIRLTKDKKIVLSHDSFINFNMIENMNYADIVKAHYLTTLDKVLSINTDKIFLIDIKVHNNYKVFGNVLIKYLSNYNRNIYLCSFNKKIINYLKRRVSYKSSYILFNYHIDNNSFVMVNYNGISDKKSMNIKGKEIFLWTISNSAEFKKVKNKFSKIDDYYLIIDKKE